MQETTTQKHATKNKKIVQPTQLSAATKTIQPVHIAQAIVEMTEIGARAMMKANVIESVRIGYSFVTTKDRFVDFLRRIQNPAIQLTPFGKELMDSMN